MLIDLTSKGVPGKVAAKALDRARLETNYNAVPYDTRKPFDPSGLRIGTAAVTSRGMGEDQMRQIARWMDQVVTAAAAGDEAVVERVAGEVADLTKGFPAPGILL